MCISRLGAPSLSIAEKYSFAQIACTRSPDPGQTMKVGGTLRGIFGVAPFANGVGPGYTRTTKFGRAENLSGPAFFSSNAAKKIGVAEASSAPAEKPMIPIFWGSIFHSAARAR